MELMRMVPADYEPLLLYRTRTHPIRRLLERALHTAVLLYISSQNH